MRVADAQVRQYEMPSIVLPLAQLDELERAGTLERGTSLLSLAGSAGDRIGALERVIRYEAGDPTMHEGPYPPEEGWYYLPAGLGKEHHDSAEARASAREMARLQPGTPYAVLTIWARAVAEPTRSREGNPTATIRVRLGQRIYDELMQRDVDAPLMGPETPIERRSFAAAMFSGSPSGIELDRLGAHYLFRDPDGGLHGLSHDASNRRAKGLLDRVWSIQDRYAGEVSKLLDTTSNPIEPASGAWTTGAVASKDLKRRWRTEGEALDWLQRRGRHGQTISRIVGGYLGDTRQDPPEYAWIAWPNGEMPTGTHEEMTLLAASKAAASPGVPRWIAQVVHRKTVEQKQAKFQKVTADAILQDLIEDIDRQAPWGGFEAWLDQQDPALRDWYVLNREGRRMSGLMSASRAKDRSKTSMRQILEVSIKMALRDAGRALRICDAITALPDALVWGDWTLPASWHTDKYDRRSCDARPGEEQVWQAPDASSWFVLEDPVSGWWVKRATDGKQDALDVAFGDATFLDPPPHRQGIAVLRPYRWVVPYQATKRQRTSICGWKLTSAIPRGSGTRILCMLGGKRLVAYGVTGHCSKEEAVCEAIRQTLADGNRRLVAQFLGASITDQEEEGDPSSEPSMAVARKERIGLPFSEEEEILI